MNEKGDARSVSFFDFSRSPIIYFSVYAFRFPTFPAPPKKSFPTEGISWQKPNRIRTRDRKPRLTYIEIPEGEDTLEHGSIYNCLSLRSETACSDSRSRSARNFHPGTRAGHLHKRHSGQARTMSGEHVVSDSIGDCPHRAGTAGNRPGRNDGRTGKKVRLAYIPPPQNSYNHGSKVRTGRAEKDDPTGVTRNRCRSFRTRIRRGNDSTEPSQSASATRSAKTGNRPTKRTETDRRTYRR